ncbi:MAG TPA: hypothetical protein VK615_13825, partial [Candidatus Binatia bacterium]|nr:hypothetical protein [Candidatus Binatia bacterium]
MTPRTVVETNLNRARSRWRGLRLLQYTSTLAIIICGILLLIAWALIEGWNVSPWAVRLLFGLLVGAAALTWVIIAACVSTDSPPRAWLAAVLERGHSPLQDRVNTSVFLEGAARRNTLLRSFHQRIVKQAQSILAQARPGLRMAAIRPLVHMWAALAVVLVTLWVYNHYSPWSRYMAAYQERLQANNA